MTPIPISVVDKFERYEALKLQAKEIDAEMSGLKEELIDYVPEGGLTTHKGKFTISSKGKYLYSERTQQTEKELKDTKKYEEQAGIAVAQPGTPFLVYKENGSKDEV